MISFHSGVLASVHSNTYAAPEFGEEELAALSKRLDAAGGTVVPEEATICCYAQSDKNWTEDPQGTRWETFHTFGDATTYYAADAACATDGAACTPNVAAMKPKVNKGTPCCSTSAACC